MTLESNILEDINNFVDIQYQKVSEILLEVYSDDNIVSYLSKISKNPEMKYDYYTLKGIDGLIKNYLNTDPYLTDFIVLGTDSTVFFRNNDANRSISLLYDFGQSPLLDILDKSESRIELFTDLDTEYYIFDNKPVLSYICKIKNPDSFPNEKALGTMIINFSLDSIRDSYREYSDNTIGDFIVLSKNNQILFSSENDLTGSYTQDFNNLKENNSMIRIKNENYYMNYRKSEYQDLVFINLISQKDLFRQIRKIKKSSSLMIYVVILITILLSITIFRYFKKRLSLLINHIGLVREGNLMIKFEDDTNDEIGILGNAFNEMSAQLKDFIDREYISEIHLKQSEFKALLAQINPHFLYNTLEVLRIQAEKNRNYDLSRMISILGQYFRWSVKKNNRIISIAEELEYLYLYLELQNIRFDQEIQSQIKIEDEIQNLGIPKLLIQPIVENTFVHGFKQNKSVYQISIHGTIKNNRVHMKIIDNGAGVDSEKINDLLNRENPEGSIGLYNINKRLKILFGESSGLNIMSSIDKGMHIELVFPAMREWEMTEYVQGIIS